MESDIGFNMIKQLVYKKNMYKVKIKIKCRKHAFKT